MSNQIDEKNERINIYKTNCNAAGKILNTMQPLYIDIVKKSELFSRFLSKNTTAPLNAVESQIAVVQIETQAQMMEVDTNSEQFSSELPSSITTPVNAIESQITPVKIRTPKKVLAKSKKETNAKRSICKHKCPDCEYSTNKKDTLNVHRAEFCVTPSIKNRQCNFCNKFFTRRGLRVHINQYVIKKHTPSGRHKNVSFTNHKEYLDEIKART